MQRGCCFSRVEVGIRPISRDKNEIPKKDRQLFVLAVTDPSSLSFLLRGLKRRGREEHSRPSLGMPSSG